jgi:hypothetical protein
VKILSVKILSVKILVGQNSVGQMYQNHFFRSICKFDSFLVNFLLKNSKWSKSQSWHFREILCMGLFLRISSRIDKNISSSIPDPW